MPCKKTVPDTADFAMAYSSVPCGLVEAHAFSPSLWRLPMVQRIRILRYHYGINSSATSLHTKSMNTYGKRPPLRHIQESTLL